MIGPKKPLESRDQADPSLIGIVKDEKKAFEWYLKAADEGDLYAQYIWVIVIKMELE